MLTQRIAGASTPAKLSLLRAVAVILAVVFAVGGAFGVNRRADAIASVRTAARQLLALQDIEVRVVHADAIASSSYLVGGQEDPTQRTAYLDEVATAGDGLVAVSGAASAADVAQLSQASRLLGSYVGLVEQARANNRQGFPVGAAYQRQANGIVSNSDPKAPDIVSSLRAVEASQRDQINADLATAHRAGVWLHLLGWLLVGTLLAGSWWLAQRFRRLVNLPIAAALAALLVLLILGGTTQARSMSDTDAAVSGPLTNADRAAQARAAAFEARSQEALTLVNRGNGAANETKWKLAQATVAQALSGVGDLPVSAADAYAGYTKAHVAIRALDDGGKWDEAVKAALGAPDAPADANAVAQFDNFDRGVGGVVKTDGDGASTRLDNAIGPLRALRIVVFLVGLAVAALGAIGFGQRLREYR